LRGDVTLGNPVLNAISNSSKYVAVVLEISSDGQVTDGFLINTGASREDLHLDVPTQPYSTSDQTIANNRLLLLGTCRGLFKLHQQGPIIVGAASRYELAADAGIDGNDSHKIPLAMSDTPGWSLKITANGMVKATPGSIDE
jgi:hypothetical protein